MADTRAADKEEALRKTIGELRQDVEKERKKVAQINRDKVRLESVWQRGNQPSIMRGAVAW